VLDVSDFAHRPGSLRRVALSAHAPADLGIEVVGVPEGADLELDLRLEAVVEGVLVSGTVRAPLSGECVRCLDPIDDNVEVDLQELYVFDGEGSVDWEELALEADLLDLEPVLRDAVVLALPQAPLCRDDCPGLCPECGARLADVPGHRHTSVDPRWAALSGLSVPGERLPSTTTQMNSAGHAGQSEES